MPPRDLILDVTPAITVVIPTGGDRRLALLAATIAGMRAHHGDIQIVVAETGARCHALPIARAWGCDHVFAPDPGPFNRGRALNMGTPLARAETLLWCDGDVLFGADFLSRALAEMADRRLDCLLPFSAIHGLGEADTARVLAGRRTAAACRPATIYGPPHPGTVALVRTAFVRRHGGMIEAFRGWGYDDNAWAHKVALLGRIGWTLRGDQRIWHLFHPQHTRDLSNVAGNLALYGQVMAIADAPAFRRLFPSSRRHAPPWHAAARIMFVVVEDADRTGEATALARGWAARLRRLYGTEAALVSADRAAAATGAADMIVLFGEGSSADALTERLRDRPCIRVAMREDDAIWPRHPAPAAHWLLARTPAQATGPQAPDDRVWHRWWDNDPSQDEDGRAGTAPVLVQVLALALASAKRWAVAITIDRGTLPAAACDRPAFWYVAFHDGDGAEVARQDAEPRELMRLLATGDGPLVLRRTIVSPRPPSAWTIWPVDRNRRWLDRIEGSVTAAAVATGPHATPAGHRAPTARASSPAR